MQKINLIRIIAVFLIMLFILSMIVSYIFGVSFLEKHVDEDGRIGEHVKIRIEIFQNQMIYLGIFFAVIGFLMLIFSNNIASVLNKKKDLIFNILFLVVFLIVLLLVGEIILRTFFSRQIYSEYGAGPGNLRFLKNVEYNSLGFRDIERSVERNGDVFRIIVIGDSFTFGENIEDIDKVYPRVLQRKIDEKYGEDRFEIINLGMRGYSTIDAVKILGNVGLNLSPDVIILGYYINDAEGPNSRVGFEKMFFHHYSIPYELGGWLYSHSFMYYFLESRLKNLLIAVGFQRKTYEEYIVHLYSDSNPFFKKHKGYLGGFIKIGGKKNIPVVVMNIPVISDFDDYPFYFVNDYVKNITLLNKGLYLDLLPFFSEYDASELRISFMDAHTNELSNEIIANVLLDFLEEKNLIKNKGVKVN